MRRLLLIVCLKGALAAGPALAQEPPLAPATSVPAPPSSEELRTLAELLRDPAIQAWLQAQAEGPRSALPPEAAAPTTMHEMMSGRLADARAFLRELAAAVPTVPDELRRAATVLYGESQAQERGLLSVIVLLVAFGALGFGLEWLFWWATTGLRMRIIASDLATVRDRVRAVAMRVGYGQLVLLAFAMGSIGAFLLFDWPPLLKEIVLAYLLVFLGVRLVLVLGRILLAPGAERFRVVPMATPAARFWFLWSTVLVGWFLFVRVTLDLLELLGVSRPVVYLIGLGCGVVLVGLTLYVVWRHPVRATGTRQGHEHRLGAWLLSLYVIVVWMLLFTGSPTPFYVGVILLLLPLALRNTNLAINHLLRPGESETAAAVAGPSLTATCVERGLRALLLIGGAYLIAWVLGVDLVEMTMRDTMATRLLRGAINAVVIVLAADFAWHLARAWIDCKLAEVRDGGSMEVEEARRRARLRTLLPILRNVLLVVLVVMAVLMALAALGIEVGPLIAGAGVVGVAVGFGAQTLVKDVISGMFYLLDDAFRIGEYIISGSYKGTVEVVLAPFDQAPPPPRLSVHRSVRRARGRPEHEPRLGDRQDDGERDLRYRPRQGEAGDQGGQQADHGRSGARAQHHRAAQDAGRRAVRRFRHPDPPQDDDQAGRAVRHSPARLRHDQDGVRCQRHRIRLPDGHRRRRWRRQPRRWPSRRSS